jgi:hypothetical protein
MPEVGIKIIGCRGEIDACDDKVRLINEGHSKDWYRVNLDDNVDFLLAAPEYYRENIQLVECIEKKQQPEPNFLTASKVDRIIGQLKE